MTALKTSFTSAVAAVALLTCYPLASEAQDAAVGEAPSITNTPAAAAPSSIGASPRPALSEAAKALAARAKPAAGSGYDMDAAPSEADPLTPAEAPSPAPVAPGVEHAQKPDGAGNANAQTAQTAEADPLAQAVRERVAKFSFSKGDNKDDILGVTAYYGASDSKPLWMSKDGVSRKARDAAAEIGRAASWGLDPAAFEVPSLSMSASDVDALANAEIKLSLAALKYARHARGGRLDLAIFGELIDRKPVIFDPKTVLQALAAAEAPGAYLQGLHPKFPQFAKLRKALNAANGGDTSETIRIPAGPDLKAGDKNPQVALVRERLKVAGSSGSSDVFDDELADAVRRQQQFRGLNATGVIDKKFRAALNETASAQPDEKRQRIIVNMERWRWMPEDLGSIYVWDSIPEQLTRVYINGKEELREKIVVGRPTTPTPQFTARMQFVIFHPEWGVPDGIKTNEIGPRLRKYSSDFGGGFLFFGGGDGGAARFLRGQNLRVSLNGREVDPDSVDWSSADVKRYTFIQPSGGRNVLGIVKFRFPNKHDVYMHDTPDRGLFSERTRAFSHGCMRTQNPIHLAEVLLAHDKGWSPSKIKEIVDRGALEEVKLTSTIPVHIVYFTMDVGEDGALRTYGDLYGLDSRIASALAGRAVPMNLPQPAAVASDEGSSADTGEPRRKVSSRDRDVKRERDRDTSRQKRFNPFDGLFD